VTEDYGLIRTRGERIIEATESPTVAPRNFVGRLIGTSPSVRNVSIFQCANSAPTTVVDFLNGQNGQTLVLLGEGNTTIEHGTNIFTNTGANKLLAANTVYRFTQFNGLWYEAE
jgi:hypothetical protein